MTGIRLWKCVLVLVVVSGVLAATARVADEKDVIGTWKLRYEPGDGQTHQPVLTITRDGSALKGKWSDGDNKSTVKDLRLADGKLRFKVEGEYNGEPATSTFEGQVKGDAIEGECQWEYQGMSGSFSFTGKRQAARPKDGSPTANVPAIHAEDVVYGRKFGTALTMDVFTPREHANGLGVILVVSGGWFSAHDQIRPGLAEWLLARGYTVFAVVHGSNPKFTIPEILQDMSRAVRFVRFHARDYKIDPDRLGIYGGSAGGHLSLMQGTAGDRGKADSKDPVERASSRVQAVACFFPPTDFLNYSKPGEYWEHYIESTHGPEVLAQLKPVFDFHERAEKTGTFERITDRAKVRDIVKQISPITHISKDDPPTLIIHGDADKLVPIQQAESFVARLKEAGVEAKLVVKAGAGHGWKDMPKDLGLIADWFDRHLKERPGTGGVPASGSSAEEAQKELQGTWTATKAQRDGEAAQDVVGHRLSITGNRFQLRSRDGKPLYQGTFRLSPNTKPAAIDFTHEEGTLKGKAWKGIYALDGDTLRICDNAPNLDKGRPAAFEAPAGSGHIVISFQRARP